MTTKDNENSSNPSNSSNSSNSSAPSNPSNATEPTKLGDFLEYTPESALEDLDYADVKYPNKKQLKKELRATNIIIGCKLRGIRLSARFTEQELAIILGVSVGRIRQYENGEVGITLAEIFKICEELGASAGYFMVNEW